MSKIIETVTSAILPICENLGLELIEVEYRKIVSDYNLTIFIDKEGGVFLDDCENLHRAIDPILDELNPTADEPYILNVSSPGIDRPLKTQKDFEKNLGKQVCVSLYQKQDNLKKFVGKLISYDFQGNVILSVKNKNQDSTVEIEFKNIALIKPEITF